MQSVSTLSLPLTPVVAVRKLGDFSKLLGRSDVFVKEEQFQPTGTHKDRRSQLIAALAKTMEIDKVVMITAGNGGQSLIHALRGTSTKVVCIIDSSAPAEVRRHLGGAYRVIEADFSDGILLPEKTISMAREHEREIIVDVTNGFEEAYRGIISEISRYRLRNLIVPVGSGELFVGLHAEISRRNLPIRLVGVGVSEPHPLADKLYTPWTPYERRMQRIVQDGHMLVRLDGQLFEALVEKVSPYLSAEPSALAGFGALSEMELNLNGPLMVICTGNGVRYQPPLVLESMSATFPVSPSQ